MSLKCEILRAFRLKTLYLPKLIKNAEKKIKKNKKRIKLTYFSSSEAISSIETSSISEDSFIKSSPLQ